MNGALEWCFPRDNRWTTTSSLSSQLQNGKNAWPAKAKWRRSINGVRCAQINQVVFQLGTNQAACQRHQDQNDQMAATIWIQWLDNETNGNDAVCSCSVSLSWCFREVSAAPLETASPPVARWRCWLPVKISEPSSCCAVEQRAFWYGEIQAKVLLNQ